MLRFSFFIHSFQTQLYAIFMPFTYPSILEKFHLQMCSQPPSLGTERGVLFFNRKNSKFLSFLCAHNASFQDKWRLLCAARHQNFFPFSLQFFSLYFFISKFHLILEFQYESSQAIWKLDFHYELRLDFF